MRVLVCVSLVFAAVSFSFSSSVAFCFVSFCFVEVPLVLGSMDGYHQIEFLPVWKLRGNP